MTKRKYTDWDSIEPMYRAGAWSNCEICRQYAADHVNSQVWSRTVCEKSIRLQAKKKGWEKNLAEKVKEQVRENLVRAVVRIDSEKKNISDQKLTDKAIIEKAAEAGSNVILRHRREIADLVDRENVLLTRLDDSDQSTTLKDQSTILKNIAAVRAQRIALERQAHALDDGGGKEDPINKMPGEELAARIAAFEGKSK